MLSEDIIVRPVITERSSMDIQNGKYTFEVAKKATKVQISDAIEKLFEVKVLKVNTMNVQGKEKRAGVHLGKTSNWKKAIVTIDMAPKEETYLTKGAKEVKKTKKYKTSIESFGV